MVDHKKPVAELRSIEKSFPGVKALKGVSFDVRMGEVHALCGENGAGKSTLIKVLTGAYQKDGGEYLIDGEPFTPACIHQTIDKGVACIYQELSIVPQMDLAHNIFLGNLPLRPGSRSIDRKKLYEETQKILGRLGLDFSPKTLAGELSVARQQMVEIGRALTRNARVIIMDEPTSSLSDNEAEILFGLIQKLRDEGVAVIYISHKLGEVMRISDRITVIRDGENVITKNTAEFTEDELIAHMIGRDIDELYCKTAPAIGGPVLEVEGLTRAGRFEDISFTVRSGEILGFFGLVGAGRTEIMRAIFGIDRADRGKVRINGAALGASPGRAIKNGMAFCTEDRKKEGLALKLDVTSNITLPGLSQFTASGVIRRGKQQAAADRYIESLNIKTPSRAQLVCNLSGGNQQKVVLAKWLMLDPRLLILDEPTRGIDVGSKAEIYGLINALAEKGIAVICVSSELEELMGVCHRIITLCEGRITAAFDVGRTTNQKVMAAALGRVD